jgi:hypothetical protein
VITGGRFRADLVGGDDPKLLRLVGYHKWRRRTQLPYSSQRQQFVYANKSSRVASTMVSRNTGYFFLGKLWWSKGELGEKKYAEMGKGMG